jgi:archaellum component FlaC
MEAKIRELKIEIKDLRREVEELRHENNILSEQSKEDASKLED